MFLPMTNQHCQAWLSMFDRLEHVFFQKKIQAVKEAHSKCYLGPFTVCPKRVLTRILLLILFYSTFIVNEMRCLSVASSISIVFLLEKIAQISLVIRANCDYTGLSVVGRNLSISCTYLKVTKPKLERKISMGSFI